MKKTFAAVGASALGLAIVGAGAATPAAAVPTTEPCTDVLDQISSTGFVTDNWYQDCVPQYGLGKAEFTIVADQYDPTVEFPAEFVPLNEIPVEQITTSSSTSDLADIQAYYSTFVPETFPAVITPGEVDTSDPTTQHYSFASVIAPVTSIGAVTSEAQVPADVGEACSVGQSTYEGAWRATFGAVDTTFAQTIDGVPWDYTITATPLPTFFFATFGQVGFDGEWCITDGIHTVTPETLGGEIPVGEILFALVPHSPAFDPEAPLFDLGTFGRDGLTPPPPPVAPAVLADTGVDTTPLVVAAGAFAVFGTLLLAFTRVAGRRRRRA